MNAKFSLILCFLLALVGCKSTPNYDYDQSVNFAVIKTYAWIINAKKSTDEQAFYQSEINQKRIVRAIDSQLLEKGMHKVAPAQADVLINYHTSVMTRTERDISNTHPFYWSFGQSFHHNSHFGLHMNLNSLQRQYKTGSIVVDVIDSNKQLIWRGAQESRLVKRLSPEKRESQIQTTVAKIMANFPRNR